MSINIAPYLEPIGHINEILDCMFSFMGNKQLYNGPLLVNRQWHEIAERYIDPSADNQKAIYWAVKHGDLAMIDRLLADPRVSSHFPFHHSHSDSMKLLKIVQGRPEFAIYWRITELFMKDVTDEHKVKAKEFYQATHSFVFHNDSGQIKMDDLRGKISPLIDHVLNRNKNT